MPVSHCGEISTKRVSMRLSRPVSTNAPIDTSIIAKATFAPAPPPTRLLAIAAGSRVRVTQQTQAEERRRTQILTLWLPLPRDYDPEPRELMPLRASDRHKGSRQHQEAARPLFGRPVRSAALRRNSGRSSWRAGPRRAQGAPESAAPVEPRQPRPSARPQHYGKVRNLVRSNTQRSRRTAR